MGSVYYISPEQAQGLEVGPEGDLYSLGIVLYQMLVGTLPFMGEFAGRRRPQTRFAAGSGDRYRRRPHQSGMAAIVRKLLQKDPKARFASAGEVAKALREAREHPLATTPFDIPRGKEAPTPQSGPRTIPNPKPRPSQFPIVRIRSLRRLRLRMKRTRTTAAIGGARIFRSWVSSPHSCSGSRIAPRILHHE